MERKDVNILQKRCIFLIIFVSFTYVCNLFKKISHENAVWRVIGYQFLCI